jgi:hypothetical protein
MGLMPEMLLTSEGNVARHIIGRERGLIPFFDRSNKETIKGCECVGG